MKRSGIVKTLARKFPSVFRGLVTLSVRGYLPRIHKNWLVRSLAFELFSETGFPMWGSPCRLHIPRELLTVYLDYVDFLDHEPLTRRVLMGLLKAGSVFIDVGANIGYYTLLAASKVGPRGRVHAVECSLNNLTMLKENVRKNNLQIVEIHPYAAASTRGELTLQVAVLGFSALGPTLRWPNLPDIGHVVRVPAVPLDEIIVSPVDLVKISAEGADLEVLTGMERILSEYQRLSLIVEWAPLQLADAGKDPLELPRFLQEAGLGRIEVLDQYCNRRRSLKETIEMLRAGKLPNAWVCDLFVQRLPQPA